MFTTGNTSKGLEKIETVVQMLNERTKLLRIADTSPHGWQTVVEYEANPIAADDEEAQASRKSCTGENPAQGARKKGKTESFPTLQYSEWIQLRTAGS